MAKHAQNGHERKVLTFEEIQAVEDMQTEYVPIPEWGGGVVIRPLTLLEMSDIAQKAIIQKDGTATLDITKRNRLYIQHSLVEPRLTREQVEALFNKSARVASDLIQAIRVLNGEQAKPEEVQKELEDAFPE